MSDKRDHRGGADRGPATNDPAANEMEPLSAVERMKLFHEQMEVDSAGLGEYYDELPFPVDHFQEEALRAVALGSTVLVCAPTGAGKTVVGEGAVYLALRSGDRAYYTTPIKALSNQKYREFCDRFGSDNVGLLTGDVSINPDASVVVMTTEVLRNMIYADADLSELKVVVLDEIHYLADRFRGPVWEEVLIQLPAQIQIVALSATVSNSEEFGRWIAEVRGNCDVISSADRPVPLYQHMMVGQRIYELFAPGQSYAEVGPGYDLTPPRLNPDLLRAVSDRQTQTAGDRKPNYGRGRPDHREKSAAQRGRPRRVNRPRVLMKLESAGLLPAIVFIFSRAGCDDAVSAVITAGISLTTAQERQLIREEVDEVLLSIPIADHGVLNLREWQMGLERGIASHHAGLLPRLKEAVERLFAAGLLKVVYATETLSLGINMPARTVVLESLEKWNGSEHVRLSPGEYAQLTGRAGRRGIDTEGNAVVLQRGIVSPEEVAQLASRRAYPLRSAFAPGYNMVVNLLHHSTMPAVRQVLESSFAQFQADDSVVELASRLRRSEAKLAELTANLHCSAGDPREYFQLREDLSQTQKQLSRSIRAGNREAATRAMRKLRKGQAIRYRKGRRWYTSAVVVGPDQSWSTPTIKILGESAQLSTLSPHDVNQGPTVVGHVKLPSGGARRPRDRQAVSRQLRAISKQGHRVQVEQDAGTKKLSRRAEELEQAIRAHPVHSCPHRESHATVGHEWTRVKRQTDSLVEQINARTSSIAHQFERVCRVLTRLDYLHDDRITGRGEELRHIFGERDLLVAETIRLGVFDGLEPPEIAAIVSTLVFEPRGDGNRRDGVDLPTPNIAEAWSSVQRDYQRIRREEARAGVDLTEPPTAELIGVTYRWARGSTLAGVLEEQDLSGGDFVRWMRQTIDLLEQLRRIGDSDFRSRMTAAVKTLRRGVVAWTV